MASKLAQRFLPHSAGTHLPRVLVHATLITGLMASSGLVANASARPSVSVAAPFEVSPSPAGNYLSALVAGAERDTLAASTYFREALRYDPRNMELMERAFVASLSNGNIKESAVFAEKLSAKDSHNGLAQLVLGVRAVKAKKFGEARALFAKNSGRNDITANLLTAWAYAGAGDTKHAIETIDRLKEERFRVFRDYHAGLILDLAGKTDEARQRLQSAYKLDSNTLRLADAWARFSDRHGDVDEAKRVYQAFDAALPRHPLVRQAMADLEAGKTLDPLIRTPEQGVAEVLYGLGAAGGSENDELAAMIYLRLSLDLNPQNGLAVVTLADIYERTKQNERAIEMYESLPDQSPLRANADIQIGLILDTMGRSDEALKQLKAIVQEHPKDIDALTNLGNLQRAKKDYASAADTYTKVLEASDALARSNWPILYFRGICNERLKNWPAAEADFKAALGLFPNQPLVLNYLGYSWVDQNINVDEAFKMLRRAVDLRPTDGYIVDSLGWAFYRLGKYPEAQRELERAVDLKPADPTVNDHLGDVYWRLGRELEAKFQWNHARDLNPEPEDLPKILDKIEHGLVDGPKPATAGEGQPTTKTGG